MKRILDESERELLWELAWSKVLLGFDFDGTLAPIVPDPAGAVMRRTTRKLLSSVTALYPCVVISGRALRDVEPRVAGLGLRAVIGNHGIEPNFATPELRRKVAGWRASLAAATSVLHGVVLEDKVYSLALHYRRAPVIEDALEKILQALEPLRDEVRLIHGKLVVNVLPAGMPDKGEALLLERDRAGCDSAFFIGDDDTDEDVFALGTSGALLTVRVGDSSMSRAMFCVEDQVEVDALLSRLIELRQDSGLASRRAR
jgi:trehalose 6-phosphate phosphatase